MQLIRNIALCIILAIGVFGTMLYSSCKKDKCSGVNCQNGGSCNNGSCKCPAGTGGTDCSIVYRSIYSNFTYAGTGTNDDTPPATLSNYQIALYTSNGSNLADMTLLAQKMNASHNYVTHFQAPIKLSTGTATSVGFTITPTVNSKGFSITGSGTLSASSATLTITEADTTTSGYIQPTLVYTFTSLAKQ